MCLCQNCDHEYSVDLMIPDELWEEIKPFGKPPGAGLLCPVCIIIKLWHRDFKNYKAFQLTEIQ